MKCKYGPNNKKREACGITIARAIKIARAFLDTQSLKII